MALQIGLVGLPNTGKSTLFNAVTKAGAPVSAYPSSNVTTNVGVVHVPDERLDVLADMFNPKKVTPTTVEFVDIAGLVSGASRGEGLGNEFLGQVRNADALAILVRCFTDPRIVHVYETIDSIRDLETLQTELIFADLASVEKRMERTTKSARSGEKKYVQELESLKKLQAHLNAGKVANTLDLDSSELATVRELSLFTLKPRLYVANVSEDALGPAGDLLQHLDSAVSTATGELAQVARLGQRAVEEKTQVIAVSAKLEAELGELPEEDAAEYLASLGLPRLGTDRVIKAGYALLNLITYLTAGEPEVRAWTVTRGTKAPQAAGKIHSDIERGFIRAEVTAFPDLVTCGSFAAAREKGLLRVEGKEYVVQDGDVVYFRFNV